jgi:hypothetical protein
MVKQPVSTKKTKYENCHLQADHFPYNIVLIGQSLGLVKYEPHYTLLTKQNKTR